MADKFKKLLQESEFTAEQQELITEAWEQKLSEAKEEQLALLREEFAQKFEHDKGVLVETMDRFITDRISVEVQEFAEDKKALAETRAKYASEMKKHADLLESKLTDALATEIKELREDKKQIKENVSKMEKFVISQLSEEIKDFHADKKALAEERVALIRKGKEALKETKAKFVEKASKLVESTITNTLTKELSDYKDDIKIARENELGRKMFESVSGIVMKSYLYEGSEVRKLQNAAKEQEKVMESLKAELKEKDALVESTNTKLTATKSLMERNAKLNDLLKPLNAEQKIVMQDLLEGTANDKLDVTFKKYLPSVIKESSSKTTKGKLNESRVAEVTGNRSEHREPVENIEEIDELDEIVNLTFGKK